MCRRVRRRLVSRARPAAWRRKARDGRKPSEREYGPGSAVVVFAIREIGVAQNRHDALEYMGLHTVYTTGCYRFRHLLASTSRLPRFYSPLATVQRYTPASSLSLQLSPAYHSHDTSGTSSISPPLFVPHAPGCASSASVQPLESSIHCGRTQASTASFRLMLSYPPQRHGA